MKIEMIKEAGGVFRPVNDMEQEKTTKFKTGEQYKIDVPLTRIPAFHRKAFAFFNYCFNYWKGTNEFQSEIKQFDTFRKHLTVLAGFYEETYNIHGKLRIEAKSLSFGSMEQEEFEECYSALIRAALKHIFKSADDSIYDQLMSFF